MPLSVVALSVAAGTLLAAQRARAEDAVSGQFSVQNFDPAPGPRNYFVTRGVRVGRQWDWSAAAVGNYAYKPLVVRSCESQSLCETSPEDDVAVVENLATVNLMGTLNPVDRLQLSLSIPLTYVGGQGLQSDGVSLPGGLSAFAVADPELEAKYRIHGDLKEEFVVGAAVEVTAPLARVMANDEYAGAANPTVGGRVIFDGESGPFSVGGNLGGEYRSPSRIGGTNVGSELQFSAGGGFRASPVLRVKVDFFGATRFSAQSGSGGLEVLAGVEIRPLASRFMINLGAGTGLVQGVGVPTVRGFAGLQYEHEDRDRDSDGLLDAVDACPAVPEDLDGYEDSDGCPDLDNDLDMLPDLADKCPNQAEDVDGFEDTDGCPDLDNDRDGIPDVGDTCPLEAETKNGFQDADGCPDEADQDADGVPDARDQCPTEVEDTDGYQDIDGCPDVDNDQDGVLDVQDECIDEPETKNGFEDADGCPDTAPKKKR